MDTATFIKVSRKALGLTQDQLSPLINKKRTNISLYESGKTTPPGDVVLKILQLRFPGLCLSDTHYQADHIPGELENQTKSQKELAA